MSTSEDHEGLSEELERETDALQRESEKLGQDISETRSDWEAKRRDPNVPGAAPPPAEPDPSDDAERENDPPDSADHA